MKALALALVLCTGLLCASHYGLPFVVKARELALAERVQQAAERNVTLTVVLVAPPELAASRPPGLRAAPSAEALLP